jgi:enoyl-CoA hydratase/carnithine racemase
MEYETLLVERKDQVALITLNRPDKLNAVSLQMRSEFLQLLEELEVDDEVRVVIVTGAGRAFCAGADISEFGRNDGELGKQQARAIGTVKQIYEFEKPIIGAVNGIAAGDGAQWVLAFDLNIASEKARLAWPATRLGILCPYGIIRLPSEVGRFRAKELLMTNKFLSAEEAYQWGLVTKVVPHEMLMDAAMALANEIKKMPPLSIRAIKEAVNRGMEGYEYAGQVITNLSRTEDAKEGALAFMEKREPHFQGK